jgi:hypothetical protein
LTRSSKTQWELTKERRTANIGYVSKLNAFRDPTPAEQYVALVKEIESWQSTKGTKSYKIGPAYSIPQGHGINLLQDKKPFDLAMKNAKKAFLETQMEPELLQRLKKPVIAKDPDYWEEILVTFMPLIILLSLVFMFYKLKELK